MRDLMQISALVPTKKVRDICLLLEDNGAVSLMVKAYRNGEAPPAKAPQKKNGKALSTTEMSVQQQAWIKKHAKGTFYTIDLTEAWKADGFRREGLYGALEKAKKDGFLKKLGTGRYAVKG